MPLSYHQLLHTADDGPAWAESVLDAEIGRVLDNTNSSDGEPIPSFQVPGHRPSMPRRRGHPSADIDLSGTQRGAAGEGKTQRQSRTGRSNDSHTSAGQELPDANLAWDAGSVMTPTGGPPTVAMTETVGVAEAAPSSGPPEDSPQAAVWCGRVLGRRYRLTAQVGRGATSIVYRGVDEVLGRSVAVKVFDGPRSELNNPERQLAEMRALAAVDHPNLVTVYDAHVADGDDEPTYLILELVAGTTLSALLADGPLPPRRVAEIGVALAGALSAVHAASVVHRDVKPGNVLLTTSGTVKLGDFGLARILDNAAEITTGGEVMGTAAYLSPEQVASAAVLFPSDVYSLGLVLLECLTGHREYDGDPATAALARLLRRPAVPDFLPAPWPQLLTDMTDPDPLRRPTIVSVLAILDAAGEVFPVSAVSNPDEAAPTDAWSSPLEPYLRAPARSDAVERSSPRRFVLAAAAIAVATAAAVFFTGSNRSSDAIPPTPATAGIPAERVDAPQPTNSTPSPSTGTSTGANAVVAEPQTTPAPDPVVPPAQSESSTSAEPVLDQPAEEQDPNPAPVVAEPVAATQPVPPAVEQPAPSTDQPAAQSPDQPPADTPTASTDPDESGPGNNGNGKDKAADKTNGNGNGNGKGGKAKG